jgi:hypothetical protein
MTYGIIGLSLGLYVWKAQVEKRNKNRLDPQSTTASSGE